MNKHLATEVSEIESAWRSDRWNGIVRPYTAEEVCRLRGSIHIDHTLARLSSEKLWNLIQNEQHVLAPGASTSDNALQMVRAGLKVIHLGGQPMSFDDVPSALLPHEQGNVQSAVDPETVVRINSALLLSDQLHKTAGNGNIDWLAPIVAEGKTGTDDLMHAYESAKMLIEAGAAGLYFRDMIAVGRSHPHVDWRALIPTCQFISNLVAARLASDVMGVPTVLIAKTAARSATLLTNDIDERDYRYASGERTDLGHYWIRGSLETAIERAVSLAPFADMLSYETTTPDIEEARKFSAAVLSEYPGKPLVYSCSPSREWLNDMTPEDMTAFHERLGRMGYRLQTMAGTSPAGANPPTSLSEENLASVALTAHMSMQKSRAKQEVGVNALTSARDPLGSIYFAEVSKLITRVPRFQDVYGMTGSTDASAQQVMVVQKAAGR